MTIKVQAWAVDGSRTRSFKTMAGARKWAQDRVGQWPEFGSGYAVGYDGVVTIRAIAGCRLADLFPEAWARWHGSEEPAGRGGVDGEDYEVWEDVVAGRAEQFKAAYEQAPPLDMDECPF